MKLGRYEVVRELGKGAMGVVYLAKDPLIGRLVALKTIRATSHGDDDEAAEFQERFLREAQAAGILNHPSIVTVHDIGQDEGSGTSFIAMEYVEGQNLKEILAQGRALSFEQISDIVAQVADALDFAHAKGIVHRDVKPANVILLDGHRAKITDFGIAKISSSNANLTSTGQFLGTPNYMAPEQVKGLPVDGRADLFSLGICLYECLTRRKPFAGDSLTAISYKIVHEPFAPLREINPQIPEGFEEVVARVLSKDPSRRYQRGRDFASALRAVARGESPIAADPVFAEETIVTRNLERAPTLQMPFPQAAQGPAPTGMDSAAAAEAGFSNAASPRAGRPPVRDRLRRTFSGVRAAPLWKRRVPNLLFFGVIALFVAALAAGIAAVKMQSSATPAVDRAAEVKHARERQLRLDGNRLIRERRFAEAYAKFDSLSKLAPKSPAVIDILSRLSSIKEQQDQGQRTVVLAQQRLDAGIALYNEKKYQEALPVLQEAFSLNPNSDVAAQYLKLAQQEIDRSSQVVASARVPKPRGKRPEAMPTIPTAVTVASVAPPAQLTTRFNHPFRDGYIMVKVGGDVVAHENLWEDKKQIFRRRSPRPIAVTREFPAKNAELQVWVVVPSLGIQEHHTIVQSFPAGSSRTLVVSYNSGSKAFAYQFN